MSGGDVISVVILGLVVVALLILVVLQVSATTAKEKDRERLGSWMLAIWLFMLGASCIVLGGVLIRCC